MNYSRDAKSTLGQKRHGKTRSCRTRLETGNNEPRARAASRRDEAIAEQQDADRDFFAARPGRRFHIRNPFPHELTRFAAGCGISDDLARSVVVVAQLMPGIRYRHPLLIQNLNGRVSLLDHDWALCILWRILCQGHSTSSDEADLHEIFAPCEAAT